MNSTKKLILLIIDGLGIRPNFFGNTFFKAKTPTLNYLFKHYPTGTLKAAGISVGLPYSEPGNSEVGHITISAGRIIYQILQRISFAIRNGEFFKNPALLGAINHIKKNNSQLHLLGLVSSGSVHSYLEHIYALFELAKKEGLENFTLHFITDGKDAKLNEAKKIMNSVIERFNELKIGRLGTIMGRSYAMDRVDNWAMTKSAYELLTQGQGEKITDPISYLEESYQKEITDESIKPAITDQNLIIKDNDAVIFFNFREDSARQLTKAFVQEDFNNFKRKKLDNLYFATFTEYEKGLPTKVAFNFPPIINSLGEVISLNNLKQVRLAESLKSAHVKLFFNCGQEDPFINEERIIIPSLQEFSIKRDPYLKAPQITEKLTALMTEDKHNFIVVNFANADIIGHTGNFEETIRALEIIDNQIKIIYETLKNWTLIITADHGNVEEKIDPRSGEAKSEHSLNNVPFCLIGKRFKKEIITAQHELKTIGFLSDIAPTILELLDLKKPIEMSGTSLLKTLLRVK